MDNNYLSIIEKSETDKLIKCNEFTSKYGLALSHKDIMNIVQRRSEALRSTGRVEIGNWVVDKIIQEFCDSPYLSQENFGKVVYEIIDIFYYYKNETHDSVSDEDLIKFMKTSFDEKAHGDLEYLAGTILYNWCKNKNQGEG